MIFVTATTHLFLASLYAIVHGYPHSRNISSVPLPRRDSQSLNFDFTWAPERWKVPATNPQWSNAFLQNVDYTVPQNIYVTCVGDQWGLGFDDGPSQYTPDLLATLAKYGIKATFFVIGSQAILYPDILLAIHQAGHQIGSHTWSHSDMTTLSHDQIVAELVTTAMAIKQITGVTPKFWRPPYGYVNREMLAVASSLGLTSIKWLRDTGDFNLQSGTTTTDAVLSNVQSWVTAGQRNAISLQHDMYAASESIAGPVLQILMNAGVNVVRMDQCVQSDAYGGPLDKFVSAMFH